MPKIKVNEVNLYYESYGEGTPLIMVAGFTADHFAWTNLIDYYKSQYQVIVFDNRGIGQSDCPDMLYTVEMMADDTANLCKALKLESCHFMGQSMGGSIVQAIAYKYPNLVKSLVLCNTFTKIDIKFALFAKSKLPCFKNGCGMKAFIEGIMGWGFTSQYLEQEGVIDTIIEATLANPFPITEIGYKNQLNALLNFDSLSWVNQITQPCLVIGTDQDLIVSAEHTQRLASLIPGAHCHIIHNAAHVPNIEKEQEYNAIVKNFYRQISS